jgi:hypothetical protein
MHRKLRELAVGAGPVGRADARVVSATLDSRPRPSTAQAFAEQVAAGMDGPVLRYATRRKLISDAGRLGIGDFEANLIIAAVQHERRRVAEPTAPPNPTQTRQSAWSVASLVVVIAVESLLALGVWQIWMA